MSAAARFLSLVALAACASASPPVADPATKVSQMSGWASLCAFSAPHRVRIASTTRPATCRNSRPTRLAPAMLRMQQEGAAGSPGEGGQGRAEFLASIVALPDETSRREAIIKNYASMDGEGISTVVARAEQEGGVWKEMLQVLQELTNARMIAGRDLLNDLIASGELNVLDRKIVEAVKTDKIDPAFMQVLEMNIAAAERGGEEQMTQLKVLAHVYTRVQEEVEKKIDPAVGLLHRLLRNTESGIRANILEDFLKPLPEDEREMMLVDGEMKVASGAKVEPLDLSNAMSTYLARVRDSGSFNEDDVGQTYEDCRVIAKEARVAVELMWDEAMLEEFTESLTPVFQPVMSTLLKYRKEE